MHHAYVDIYDEFPGLVNHDNFDSGSDAGSHKLDSHCVNSHEHIYFYFDP
jgi:hypothetical protein